MRESIGGGGKENPPFKDVGWEKEVRHDIYR